VPRQAGSRRSCRTLAPCREYQCAASLRSALPVELRRIGGCRVRLALLTEAPCRIGWPLKRSWHWRGPSVRWRPAHRRCFSHKGQARYQPQCCQTTDVECSLRASTRIPIKCLGSRAVQERWPCAGAQSRSRRAVQAPASPVPRASARLRGKVQVKVVAHQGSCLRSPGLTPPSSGQFAASRKLPLMSNVSPHSAQREMRFATSNRSTKQAAPATANASACGGRWFAQELASAGRAVPSRHGKLTNGQWRRIPSQSKQPPLATQYRADRPNSRARRTGPSSKGARIPCSVVQIVSFGSLGN